MAKRKETEEIKLLEQNQVNEKEQEIDLTKLKKELVVYINKEIKKNFVEEIDKTNRKLVKEKNKKIIFRDIIIIFLLAVIGLLLFLMFDNRYFDKYFINKEDKVEEKEKKETEKEEKKEEVKEEDKKPSLEELINQYGSLLNYYTMNENCLYIEDFYNGNLTSDLKKYFALNTIDFASIKEEDDYKLIINDTFKKVYETLFGDDYLANTFDYNNHKISYISSLSLYMLPKTISKDMTKIKREIIDIKEENGFIYITTVEGIVDGERLLNVITGEEIMGYEHNSLVNYQESLTKISYVFKDNKLVSLVK